MTFNRLLLFGQNLIPALIVVVITGCQRVEVPPEQTDHIQVIGHGGAGFQSPRNQLPHNSPESAVKALEFYNAAGVEVDVQLSASGTLWMYHDATLQTMTNCKGCISLKKDDALKDCRYRNDARVNTFSNYTLAPLSALTERIAHYPEKPCLFLDLRTTRSACEIQADQLRSGTAKALQKLESEIDFGDHVYLSTPDRELIKLLKQHNTSFKILYESDFDEESVRYIKNENLAGLITREESVNADQVKQFRANGFQICLFGVKVQSGIASAVNKSPDFIMTDNIPLTYNVLRNIE